MTDKKKSTTIIAKTYTRTNDSGTFYLRLIVPKELRAFVAKNALWRSLSTKDTVQGQQSALLLSIASQQIYQDISNNELGSIEVNMNIDVGLDDEAMTTAIDGLDRSDLDLVTASLLKSFGIAAKSSSDKKTTVARKPAKKVTKSATVKKKTADTKSTVKRSSAKKK